MTKLELWQTVLFFLCAIQKKCGLLSDDNIPSSILNNFLHSYNDYLSFSKKVCFIYLCFFLSSFSVSVFQVICSQKMFCVTAVHLVLKCQRKQTSFPYCVTNTAVNETFLQPWGKINAILTVDLLLVFRDGHSHSDCCSNTEGSA